MACADLDVILVVFGIGLTLGALVGGLLVNLVGATDGR